LSRGIFEENHQPKSVEEHFDPVDSVQNDREERPEDFAALYFQRIQRFPVLTKFEEKDLLERWCKFKDEGAKDRIARAHLRMVPPIARKTAHKFGFEPFWPMLTAEAKRDAWTGFYEIIAELTAEGNCALANALEHYKLGSPATFYTYARTCVRNAIVRKAKELRSVVDRPFDRSAPTTFLPTRQSLTRTTSGITWGAGPIPLSATILKTMRRKAKGRHFRNCDLRPKSRKSFLETRHDASISLGVKD
jgi:DNA-directed RNA polymerase sigma subunit (sigma70/sigma32)